MVRRRRLLVFLLVLTGLFITGCTGGLPGGDLVDGAVAWITGLVTKARGEPIPNASVTLLDTGEQSVTDSRGRFSIGTTARGTVNLYAEADGYLSLGWPVSITSATISQDLHLVSLADYSDSLFRELTGASENVGIWRWDTPTVTYYVDRSGAWRPEFDAPMREAFTQWSMATRRAVAFVEGGPGSAIQIGYVSGSPCGYAEAAGCAGVTSVTAQGAVRGALIELHAGYATDVGLSVHEVGHTLSFSGHSPGAGDVMYYAMNGARAPSNQEAAVAAVQYSNAPGATTDSLRFPSAQLPPEASAPSPATVEGGTSAPAPMADLHLTPAPLLPGLSAIADLGAMIRAWFGGGCVVNLPLFCPTGGGPSLW